MTKYENTLEENKEVLSMLEAVKQGKGEALTEEGRLFEKNVDTFIEIEKENIAKQEMKAKTIMEKIKASQERKRLHKTTIHFYAADMGIIKKVAEENNMTQQAFLRDFVHENLKLLRK